MRPTFKILFVTLAMAGFGGMILAQEPQGGNEAAFIDLIVKYLWNHYDRWIDKYPDRFSEHPEWLLDCSGAALTKNGLIVYYHAPWIGCYADGQFNAVIPYEELKSLPHGLLMDIRGVSLKGVKP